MANTGEPVGDNYPTLMPDLTDVADVQDAFKMYHFGLPDYDGIEPIPLNSIEGHFGAVNERVDLIEERPVGGGEVNSSEPTVVGPGDLPVPNGYIWVDPDDVSPIIPDFPTVIYSPTEPTDLDITNTGTIWVDEDGTAAVLNVNDYLTKAEAADEYYTQSETDSIIQLVQDAAAAATFMLMGA